MALPRRLRGFERDSARLHAWTLGPPAASGEEGPLAPRFWNKERDGRAALRVPLLQYRGQRHTDMKEAICKAFCDEIRIKEVPIGLAISTAFRRADGDAIAFYVVRNAGEPGLVHLE